MPVRLKEEPILRRKSERGLNLDEEVVAVVMGEGERMSGGE